MMTIRDLEQLERLKQQIDETQRLLTVTMPKRSFFDFKSYAPQLREASERNNRIYSSHLPAEIEVSSEIALFLAINMSSAQARWKAVEERFPGWSMFAAMGSCLMAAVAPSPGAVMRAGVSVGNLISNVNEQEASLLRAKDELNPITWRYLLKFTSVGAFVLQRGAWTVRHKKEERGSYGTVNRYEMLLSNVGIDPSVCHSAVFKSIPDLPNLNVGVLEEGREGLTSSGWEP